MSDSPTVSGRPVQKPRPQGGGGSRKGIPNRSNAEARAAIAMFIDDNVYRLQRWLDEVADGVQDSEGKYVVAPNPEKAFNLFQSVIEYHVPRLARTENTTELKGSVSMFKVKSTQTTLDDDI